MVHPGGCLEEATLRGRKAQFDRLIGRFAGNQLPSASTSATHPHAHQGLSKRLTSHPRSLTTRRDGVRYGDSRPLTHLWMLVRNGALRTSTVNGRVRGEFSSCTVVIISIIHMLEPSEGHSGHTRFSGFGMYWEPPPCFPSPVWVVCGSVAATHQTDRSDDICGLQTNIHSPRRRIPRRCAIPTQGLSEELLQLSQTNRLSMSLHLGRYDPKRSSGVRGGRAQNLRELIGLTGIPLNLHTLGWANTRHVEARPQYAIEKRERER